MNNRLKSYLRGLKLVGFFTALLFAILLLSHAFSFFGVAIFHRLGLLDTRHELMPLLSYAVSSLLLGTLFSAIISSRTMKPLRQIMDATDRIADGDYSARIKLRGIDEFRELGEKFNHMAEELASVELLRSDFVNNFSHEFKTPIVSIRGFAKALKWEELSDAERDEYLDLIIAESERLSDLATNVLQLSKLEQQSILTDKRRCNISEQIRLAIALIDEKWSHKRLDFCIDTDEIYANGNEELLKQVWINLLDNAAKFSPDGGEISIAVARKGEGCEVAIANESEPPGEGELEHAFDKFYQGDRSRSTKGNGLGLTIVDRIVRLHKGSVEVSADGERVVFTVRLAG